MADEHDVAAGAPRTALGAWKKVKPAAGLQPDVASGAAESDERKMLVVSDDRYSGKPLEVDEHNRLGLMTHLYWRVKEELDGCFVYRFVHFECMGRDTCRCVEVVHRVPRRKYTDPIGPDGDGSRHEVHMSMRPLATKEGEEHGTLFIGGSRECVSDESQFKAAMQSTLNFIKAMSELSR